MVLGPRLPGQAEKGRNKWSRPHSRTPSRMLPSASSSLAPWSTHCSSARFPEDELSVSTKPSALNRACGESVSHRWQLKLWDFPNRCVGVRRGTPIPGTQELNPVITHLLHSSPSCLGRWSQGANTPLTPATGDLKPQTPPHIVPFASSHSSACGAERSANWSSPTWAGPHPSGEAEPGRSELELGPLKVGQLRRFRTS